MHVHGSLVSWPSGPQILKHTGLFVLMSLTLLHKYKGLLWHKCKGLLLHKCKGLLLHKYKGLLLHKCKGLLLHKCKGLLLHKCKGLLLHKCKGLLLHKCKGLLLHKCKGLLSPIFLRHTGSLNTHIGLIRILAKVGHRSEAIYIPSTKLSDLTLRLTEFEKRT